MKLLFIGGTGNISAACVRLAQAQGHEVYLLNRGTRPLQDYGIRGAVPILADIHNEQETSSALGNLNFDVVANFIAFKPEEVERDIRLFAGRCAQYIFISSASAYQKPPLQPVITECTPLKNPFWDYSRNKIACEDACIRAYRERDFPATIVRPSHTYETVIPVAIGGWTDFTIVERMRAGQPVIVHGDGTSLWTLTHSQDFAKGFNGLFGRQEALGVAFHITSDEVLTWNQIYDAVSIAAGAGPAHKVHVPSDFIARLVPALGNGLLGDKAHCAIFDNSRIKRLVPDFKATTLFQDGIRRTIRWFEEKPGRIRTDPATGATIDRILAAYQPMFKNLESL